MYSEIKILEKNFIVFAVETDHFDFDMNFSSNLIINKNGKYSISTKVQERCYSRKFLELEKGKAEKAILEHCKERAEIIFGDSE